MAPRRPIKAIPFSLLASKTTKTPSYSTFSTSSCSYSNAAFIQNSLHTQNTYTHFTQTRYFSVNTEFPPNTHTDTVKTFLTIFTKKPPLTHQDNEELQILGSRLTTETVEAVLKCTKSWKIAHQFFTWATEQVRYKHNCYTFNTMASILSEARKPSQLRVLALDFVNSRTPMTAGALGFMIRCLGNSGLVDEAIQLFDEVKRLRLCVVNNYSYNCLLEAIAKSGRVELVEMRLKEMREEGWWPDKFTLTPVLQTYCNAKRFEEALSVFNHIYEQGWVDERIYTILLMSFSKWGDVDKAFELIQRMEDHNMTPNEKTLCSLIHGFAKEGRVDKALQLFDKMRNLGINPDLRVYSVLIEGLCKKKEHDKVLELYSEVKSRGIVPDTYVITKLISSFSGKGDFVTANKFFEEGQELVKGEDIVLLHNAVLSGLVDYGLVEKATMLLRATMEAERDREPLVDNFFKVKEKVVPNSISFNIVIDGLYKTDQLDEALKLFNDMVQIGCEGTVLLYNNLINALCNKDRLSESFKLLWEMKESGIKPTHFTHNCIFGCLCRQGNVPAALDLVKEMRICGHEPWIKHSTMLVKQLCTHRRALEACNFLNEMAQDGFLPDIVAYSAAIDGLFRIREIDRAMELFHEIFKRGHCPDVVAYNIVIRGLSKVGRVSESEHYLNEMLEKGLSPSVVTYNSMIDGFCKANELDQALICFKRMVDESREPTVITYTTLMDGLCNAGRPDGALMLWDEMERKGCIPSKISYMALVNGLCKCGRPDAARTYYHKMKEKEMSPDTYAYVAMISGFISKGDPPLALEVLKEMVGKEEFPGQLDKNYSILMDAILKLSSDSTTSSDVKKLIAEGCIPEVSAVSQTDQIP